MLRGIARGAARGLARMRAARAAKRAAKATSRSHKKPQPKKNTETGEDAHAYIEAGAISGRTPDSQPPTPKAPEKKRRSLPAKIAKGTLYYGIAFIPKLIVWDIVAKRILAPAAKALIGMTLGAFVGYLMLVIAYNYVSNKIQQAWDNMINGAVELVTEYKNDIQESLQNLSDRISDNYYALKDGLSFHLKIIINTPEDWQAPEWTKDIIVTIEEASWENITKWLEEQAANIQTTAENINLNDISRSIREEITYYLPERTAIKWPPFSSDGQWVNKFDILSTLPPPPLPEKAPPPPEIEPPQTEPIPPSSGETSIASTKPREYRALAVAIDQNSPYGDFYPHREPELSKAKTKAKEHCEQSTESNCIIAAELKPEITGCIFMIPIPDIRAHFHSPTDLHHDLQQRLKEKSISNATIAFNGSVMTATIVETATFPMPPYHTADIERKLMQAVDETFGTRSVRRGLYCNNGQTMHHQYRTTAPASHYE